MQVIRVRRWHLIYRQAKEPTHVLLFERRRRHGLGAAYSTTNPEHLLNVPAGGMSGLDDDPDDFVKFLLRDRRAAPYIRADKEIRNQFVSRMVYGWYIPDLLEKSHVPSSHGAIVETITDDVTDVLAIDQFFCFIPAVDK